MAYHGKCYRIQMDSLPFNQSISFFSFLIHTPCHSLVVQTNFLENDDLVHRNIEFLLINSIYYVIQSRCRLFIYAINVISKRWMNLVGSLMPIKTKKVQVILRYPQIGSKSESFWAALTRILSLILRKIVFEISRNANIYILDNNPLDIRVSCRVITAKIHLLLLGILSDCRIAAII
jgi:hypothetical protein